jgi:hypothetical protein
MRGRFSVQVHASRRITTITGMWPVERQRALLTALMEEPTTLEGAELTDMLTMALQDLEPVECGMVLLEFLLGKEMTRGMRDDVSRDMADAEPWQNHSHMHWHRSIFEAGVLLWEAHGGAVNRPYGRSIEATVLAQDEPARALLSEPMTPALAARLLAPCVPDGILDRLFEEELAGPAFADAEHVVWHCALTDREGDTAQLVVEGSEHWWAAAKAGDAIEVVAWPDVPEEDED